MGVGERMEETMWLRGLRVWMMQPRFERHGR